MRKHKTPLLQTFWRRFGNRLAQPMQGSKVQFLNSFPRCFFLDLIVQQFSTIFSAEC